MGTSLTNAFDGLTSTTIETRDAVIQGFWRVYVRPIKSINDTSATGKDWCYHNPNDGATKYYPDGIPLNDGWLLLGLAKKEDGIEVSFDPEIYETYASGRGKAIKSKVTNITGTMTIPLIQAGYYIGVEQMSLAWGHDIEQAISGTPIDGSYIKQSETSPTSTTYRQLLRQAMGSPGCITGVQLRIDVPQKRECGGDLPALINSRTGNDLIEYPEADYLMQNWIFYDTKISLDHSHSFVDGDDIMIPLTYKLFPVGREYIGTGSNIHPTFSSDGYWLGEVFTEIDYVDTP